jgi:hypothetical protein
MFQEWSDIETFGTWREGFWEEGEAGGRMYLVHGMLLKPLFENTILDLANPLRRNRGSLSQQHIPAASSTSL